MVIGGAKNADFVARFHRVTLRELRGSIDVSSGAAPLNTMEAPLHIAQQMQYAILALFAPVSSR